MNARAYITLLIAAIVLISVSPVSGQRLIATVSVETSKLPSANENKLHGLDKIIEAYINQEEWAPDDYNYDVFMDITISFDDAKAISFEDRYSALITVSNRGDAVYTEKKWDFPLQPGVTLVPSFDFDPFRSMIDYYVQTILGHEFDKVKKFGGTPYFEKARQIAQNARFSSLFYLGWDKREKRIETYLDKRNEHYRYLNFLYYTGEWLYYEERDRDMAKQYLLFAIKQFEKVEPEQLKRFFSLNAHNYANALAEYKEFTSLRKMASLDPDHVDVYEPLLRKE